MSVPPIAVVEVLIPGPRGPAGDGSASQADWNASSGPSQILNKPTLGSAAAANTSAFDPAGAAAAAAAASQPLDSDLTAIAQLTTTSFGRGLLTLADAAAGRAALGDLAVGAASSIDNTLPRFDGTGGKTLQASGVTVGDNNEISGYRGNINAQTGTSYTLQASDTGKIVELTNAGAIALTIPSSLPVGFCCTIVQGGAGQVTVAAGSGATQRNRQSHTKLAGQWAPATIYVRANSGGAAAEYVFAGDTAA